MIEPRRREGRENGKRTKNSYALLSFAPFAPSRFRMNQEVVCGLR
jgi:hypothetical protein